MVTLSYDGSFMGLLTVIFEIYDSKYDQVEIVSGHKIQNNIFGNIHQVDTQIEKADRVIKGLKNLISARALKQLYDSFLSEDKGVENKLYAYIHYVFSANQNIEKDYSNPFVLYVAETAKKVHREKHRMEAFIRFQLTKDQIYYAICEPDFNVLPLIKEHFTKRYADQKWLIFDAKRKYGLFYDLEKVEEVQMVFSENINSVKKISAIFDEHEILYQQLWKNYFKSINIVARKNTKLHIQHMPKRYWKHLTEKSIN